MSEIIKVSIGQLTEKKTNPRTIDKTALETLIVSLLLFPQMLEKRPLIVVTKKNRLEILGGNQRLKALQTINDIFTQSKAGNPIPDFLEKKGLDVSQLTFFSEIPVIIADDWSKQQQHEFVVKDNLAYGKWDWEQLQVDYDVSTLQEWGVEIPDWVLGGENVNIEDFFDVDAEKQEKGKIVLNYTEDEYKAVIEAFGRHSGTKEQIVFNLLGC